jgi:hypothetical protein
VTLISAPEFHNASKIVTARVYRGTICMPFIGARWVPSDAVLGIADNVNPVALIVNTT